MDCVGDSTIVNFVWCQGIIVVGLPYIFCVDGKSNMDNTIEAQTAADLFINTVC